MSLFHDPRYLALHEECRTWSQRGCGLAMRPSTIMGNWESPPGTFGGFSKPQFADMEDVLLQMESDTGHGVYKIKLPPECHNPEMFAYSVNVLTRCRYSVSVAEINYHRDVVGRFDNEMVSRGQKRCLSAGKERGRRVHHYGLTIFAYKLLAANRERKGRTLSMTHEFLRRMLAAIPGSVVTFELVEEEELLAAAICIRLSKRVLYVWAWGDSVGATHSPTVQLAQSIYEYCEQEDIRQLDLGIATDHNGMPDDGLIRFKESLGFRASAKLTMVKG